MDIVREQFSQPVGFNRRRERDYRIHVPLPAPDLLDLRRYDQRFPARNTFAGERPSPAVDQFASE